MSLYEIISGFPFGHESVSVYLWLYITEACVTALFASKIDVSQLNYIKVVNYFSPN